MTKQIWLYLHKSGASGGRKKSVSKGFTLIEILAALTIIGILAAIAIPSLLSYREQGERINRMNIARTIYIAAQNQLTELRINKNLKAEMTALGYYNMVEGRYEENMATLAGDSVSSHLGGDFPPEELAAGNRHYIQYLSKRQGESSDILTRLLEPVILDASILNGAILIEYNIRTGAVLSVFYSEKIREFTYDSGDPGSILGPRGMGPGGYEPIAHSLKQGFYGIGYTGIEDIFLPATIDIYDSYTRPLPDDAENQNVLYAELHIPEKNLSGPFNLLLNGQVAESGLSLTGLNSTLEQALLFYSAASHSALLYRYDGDINFHSDGSPLPPDQHYARIIWVLDYVGGDMTDSSPTTNRKHSIGQKYGALNLGAGRINIRAGISGALSASSFREAHPYFYTEYAEAYLNNRFTIMSARHLYNIAYLPGGDFSQKADIILDGGDNPLRNFQPIPAFSGSFTGSGYVISNLTIALPGHDNVGLFATINAPRIAPGGAYSRASVLGLSLENPQIQGGNNVGAICGQLDGFISGSFVQFSNSSRGQSSSISGNENVGGLIGENLGLITDSALLSPNDSQHIAGSIGPSCGGLVGANRSGAQLKRLLFLAPAPANGGQINPITGSNSSAAANLHKLYYLSGPAIRPATIGGSNNYNTASAPGPGQGLSSDQLYLEAANLGWQNAPLIQEQILTTTNTVYPYPYSSYAPPALPANPNWPLAGSSSLSPGFCYYELYQDGSWGYSSMADSLAPAGSSKVVVNDGYGLELAFLDGTYTLHLGSNSYTIRGSGTSAAPSWLIMDSSGHTLSWPQPRRFSSPGLGERFRLFIPNSVFLSALGSSGSTLNLSLYEEGNPTALLQLNAFNPLFAQITPLPAPAGSYIVRSPRHLVNISRLLGANYNQQLNMDFQPYGLELNSSYMVDSSTLLRPVRTAVSGLFRGNYDGEGRIISRLTINGSYDQSGLFENNNGIIENLILASSAIRGRDQVGGLAALNSGTIRHVTLENCSVVGRNSVGGLIGENSGQLDFCALQTAVSAPGSVGDPVTVSGTLQVGGLTGVNSGRINNVYLVSNSNNAAVQGTTYCGGLVGVNAGYIDKALYLARLQSGSYSLVGQAVVAPTNAYYLSYESSSLLGADKSYNYALNRADFMTGTYNGQGGRRTLSIYNLNISSWSGWTKAAPPADGLGAFTEEDLLQNFRHRMGDYPYPHFTLGPKPSQWPLTGIISNST